VPGSVPDLTLVVACYNEEESLPRLFRELEKLLSLSRARGLLVELVFVDDGSRDGTAAGLAGFCGERGGRRILTHAENRGFGAAMRTGLAGARGRVLVCYDADATYPIEDVLTLYDRVDDADVAGASPFAGRGLVRTGRVRGALSLLAAKLYRLALRDRAAELTAFTCAFRAYRTERLRGLPWRADGFLAAAEVLVRFLLTGARVREVPSTLSQRRAGRSKMRVLRTALAHLRLAVATALRAASLREATPGRAEPPGETPAERNARLNRDWPMERIERHPRSAVRGVEARRRREVLRLLGARSGDRVLDVGSGTGFHARRLAEAGARPVALDLDAGVLAAGPPPAVSADAAALPFAAGAFDGVLLAEVLEHCPDPSRVLAEGARVLRDGGRLASSVPDDIRIVPVKRMLRALGLGGLLAGLPPGLAPGHLHVFEPRRLRRLLHGAGPVDVFRRDLRALAFLALIRVGTEAR
jgi:SAM-dependent methyltransferase